MPRAGVTAQGKLRRPEHVGRGHRLPDSLITASRPVFLPSPPQNEGVEFFHGRFGMLHGALEKKISQHSRTEVFAEDQAKRALFSEGVYCAELSMHSNSAINLEALEVGKLAWIEELNRGGTGQWTLVQSRALGSH